MEIHIASSITDNYCGLLYILMGSVKANKQHDTEIVYHVFIPYQGLQDHDYYKCFFESLEDATFHIDIRDMMPGVKKLGNLEPPLIFYIRCLLPGIFKELDKLFYLDADVLCYNPGIENYWAMDLTDCYAAVAPDPAICYSKRYAPERRNTKTQPYFNAGVILYNLEYMRTSGMDKTLEDWCCNGWRYDQVLPIHHDQTLQNWLYKEHLKWMPCTFNNQMLTSWGYKIATHEIQAAHDGYATPLATLKDTVFFHFCDHNKPWSAVLMFPELTYPYHSIAKDIWKEAVEKYAKKPSVKDWGCVIHIATAATYDRADQIGILLNSLKWHKKGDTKIVFYLYVPQAEISRFEQYLSRLVSPDLVIEMRNVDLFSNRIDVKGTIRNHIYYARLLFLNDFLELDQLLYMDVDMVCIGEGIEDLWCTDVEGYWLGACIDPTWQYCPYFHHDIENTKTDHYFNNGMMLMNLKQMRIDHKDEEMADWCFYWDKTRLICHCYDQTLMNYLLKDKVKLLNTKYNNSLLASLGIAKEAYTRYMKEQGYDNPLDSLKDAVLVHFCGSKKPWDAKALACGMDDYPYKVEAAKLWKEIDARFNLNGPKKPEVVLSVKDATVDNMTQLC